MKGYLVTLITAAGLVVGCNRSLEKASQDFNTLPPAVQKTVRAQAPNGEIASDNRRFQPDQRWRDRDQQQRDQSQQRRTRHCLHNCQHPRHEAAHEV